MTLQTFRRSPLLDDTFPLPLDRPFHRQQALREGVPRTWLTALVASGHLRRVLRGVYVAAQQPDSTALRIDSLRLVVPGDAVVCDRHAGWLHGANMVLAPGEDVHAQPIRVFRFPGHGRLRHSQVSSGQRALLATDVVDLDGLLVTTPLRTTLDLGRSRSRVTALSGIDAMLRTGVSRDEVVCEAGRLASERWVRTLREVAPLGDPRSASPGESATKLAWWDATGTMPDLQIEVTAVGGRPAYLDVGSREMRFAVEYDGEEWHGTDQQMEDDAQRRSAIADRYGYDIAVVDAAAVYGPSAHIEGVIRKGLERARRARGVPFVPTRRADRAVRANSAR